MERALELAKVDAIAREVAEKHLAVLGIQNVESQPTTDSEGKDALRITITIRSADRIAERGGQALDALSEILARLENAGDTRFPIIDYITEEELTDVDDSAP